ncbi:hypothetical protein [Chitinophaga sp.]|uniref:hypothetical protein n=1 Tax=Chitinophaga sp. TaxID=1869181 RepID=UPI0031D680BA
MKIILWLLFIVLVIITGQEAHIIQVNAGDQATLLHLEFTDFAAGKKILDCWRGITYGEGTLLSLAQSNTRTDFLFLITYTLLLISYSNSQMQQERNPALNNLLRLNLFLAVLAGLCDVSENLILLYDMRHAGEITRYVSSSWVSIAKWLLIGWVILIWLISLIRCRVMREKRTCYVSV